MRRPASCALVLGWLGAPVAAQEFPAWVGLYEPSQLRWLENENRITELCRDTAELDACYAEMLGPRLHGFDLFTEPDASSDRVGALIVVATPGRGLSAHFRPAESDEPVSVRPDVFLQDWGYGPYFHQTFLERRGDWYRLPPGAWPRAVWLRHRPEVGDALVVSVVAGDIIEMDESGWYVVEAEAEALLLRPEQAGDVWCEEGDPPPVVPVEPVRRSRSELRDSLGHLSFSPKYMKGC
jgi:hypothetical protein